MTTDLHTRLQNEADLCRNDGAEDIAALLDEAAAALAATPSTSPAAAAFECKAAKVDGVLCANEECDIAAGHRPAPAVERGVAEERERLLREAEAQVSHLIVDLVVEREDCDGLSYYWPKGGLLFSNLIGALIRWREQARAALFTTGKEQA